MNYWSFRGNLENVSCSFHFRIFSEECVDRLIGALKDPYFKNITVRKVNMEVAQ